MNWDLAVKFNNQSWKPLSNESDYQITEKNKKANLWICRRRRGSRFRHGQESRQ